MAERKPDPSGKAGAKNTAKPPTGKSSSTRAGVNRAGGDIRRAAGDRGSERRSTVTSGARKQPPRKPGKSIVNQKQTPWGLIAAATAVAVFAAVIIVALIATHKKSSHMARSGSAGGQVIPTTPSGTLTVQKRVARVANTTGIKGVIAYDTKGWPGNGKSSPGAMEHQHVTGPVKYSINPPAGGPHNSEWMNAGVYTRPIPNERAVHNLEHGAIWITYDTNLPAGQVRTLQAFVAKQSYLDDAQASGIPDQANRYIDLSPWASSTLPAKMVMSAWGYQLYLTSPTDPRMQQFIDKFRSTKSYSPEYGSAVDGIPVTVGGRAAEPGSKIANPASS